MPDRQKHQQEVRSFLQEHFPIHDWDFSIPHGTGMETYFVQGNRQEYFVKVGAPVERYRAIAEIGLTPQVLAAGCLTDGTSIIVQPYITGKIPHGEIITLTLNNLRQPLAKCIIVPK